MKTHKILLTTFIALVLSVSFLGTLHSQDVSPLIDILVRKNIITHQEAEGVRAELRQEQAQIAGGKLDLPEHVSKFKLKGDARLRYEYAREQYQDGQARAKEQTRPRVFLRLDGEYIFNEALSAGVGFQSGETSVTNGSNAANSGNATLDNGFQNLDVFLSKVWLEWKPSKWLTLTLGKQNNPFYKTPLLWDSDINPTGARESFYWSPNDRVSFALNAGQFIFDVNTDSPTTIVTDDNDRRSPWMFSQQLVAQVKATENLKFTVAPGFMTYYHGAVAGVSGGNPLNGTYATNHLNIINLAGDVSVNLGKIPLKFYWDAAWNLSGDERMSDVMGIKTAAQIKANGIDNSDMINNAAWLVGVSLGKLKKKGDWKASVDFRQIGLTSVDPNINDGDFASSNLNQQGVRASVGYSFTRFCLGSISYYHTWNFRKNLEHAAIADLNTSDLIQGNLIFKF